MVVEDEPLIRLGISVMLESAGHAVTEASNADDALRKFERDDSYDLVITDIDMPGSMDGVGLAKLVAARWPAMQLIVVSGKVGRTEIDIPDKAYFFGKPYQERLVLELIDSMGGGRGAL